MNTFSYLIPAQVAVEIRLTPIAGLVGLGFLGHAIAGPLGAGIALLLPISLQLLIATVEALLY